MQDGKRLKIVREHLGFQPQEFADILKIKSQKLADIERGKVNVPVETALFLDGKYSINFKWTVTGVGEMEKIPKESGSIEPNTSHDIITRLEEWLTEISTDEPNRLPWFEMELKDKFPPFKEWLKKRDQTNTETGHQQAA